MLVDRFVRPLDFRFVFFAMGSTVIEQGHRRRAPADPRDSSQWGPDWRNGTRAGYGIHLTPQDHRDADRSA